MLPQLACSFSFEVLLKLLPSLACGSSTFHSPASISLVQGLASGGAAERPRECSYPSRSKGSRPGPITGAPLQSVPHGHRDTNKGPGLVAPHGRGRELSTCGHVAGRYDNKSKTMINSNNPNTPPRGSTLLSFLRRKKGKERTDRAQLVSHRPAGKTRVASGAQADSLSRFTGARRRADTLPPPKQMRRRGG